MKREWELSSWSEMQRRSCRRREEMGRQRKTLVER
jgi:hypothetical protein